MDKTFSFYKWHSVLPSSLVLLDFTELRGPSPTEVKANTLNSYSVYLASPVTVLERIAPLVIISVVVGEPAGFFFL